MQLFKIACQSEARQYAKNRRVRVQMEESDTRERQKVIELYQVCVCVCVCVYINTLNTQKAFAAERHYRQTLATRMRHIQCDSADWRKDIDKLYAQVESIRLTCYGHDRSAADEAIIQQECVQEMKVRVNTHTYTHILLDTAILMSKYNSKGES
jgi:hypothetical protein